MAGVLRRSGISWTICKQSAPRSRQITTPALHHLVFHRPDALPTPNQQCQSTEGILFALLLVKKEATVHAQNHAWQTQSQTQFPATVE